MIDFNKYPKTKEVTYTIIPRYYSGEFKIALEQNKVKDWKIRTCRAHDKSMLEDIKEHLPEWFDARYSVLISHFDSQYVLNHIDEICYDEDVLKEIKESNRLTEDDYKAIKEWNEKHKTDNKQI